MITQIAILEEPHFAYKLPILGQYTIVQVAENTIKVEDKSINKNLVICLPSDTAWEQLRCLYNKYQQSLDDFANQLRSLKKNKKFILSGDTIIFAKDPDNNQSVTSSIWEIPIRCDAVAQLYGEDKVELSNGEIVLQSDTYVCPNHDVLKHCYKLHTACEIASSEMRKYLRELGTYADAEKDGRYLPEYNGLTLDEVRASKLITEGKLEMQQLENDSDGKEGKYLLKIQDKMTGLGRKLKELKQFLEIQPGWIVDRFGTTGVVFEKLLTVGGMPQIWVLWGEKSTPDIENIGGSKYFPPKLEVVNVEPVIEVKPKPVLRDDAPKAIILFAGGGGIEAGMVEAGIRPIISVELDPTKLALSGRIADTHHKNFDDYGCRTIRETVQDVAAADFPDFPRNPDFLHASPVCSNFSLAKGKEAIESDDDITAAIAVAKALAILQPTNFTLEQVPGYLRSSSFKKIKIALDEHGYKVDVQILSMADYGVPQARRRLVLRASKSEIPQLPAKQNHIGWHSAIAHLIPGMEDSELIPGQQKSVEKQVQKEPTPLLLFRTGEYRCTKGSNPARTIRRCFFTDGDGANRNQWANIWLPDGTVKNVSIEAAAILQGFPDWYELPSDVSTAGSILGYSVPPLFASQMFSQWLNPNSQYDLNDSQLLTSNHPVVEKLLPGYAFGQNLTHAEAQKLVDTVSNTANRLEALMQIAIKKANLIRVCINLLDVGQGYKNLGFGSMTELFKSGILGYSRSNLQKQWQAAQVEMNLAVDVGTLPEDHCRKLSPLISKPDLLKQAYDNALKRAKEEKNKKLTAKLIASSVAAITGDIKPIKSKSKWRRNRDGSRHYYVNLCGVERQVQQDIYQQEFVELEEVCKVQNRTSESLIAEGLLKLVADKFGCTEQGAIALAVKEMLSQNVGAVAA